MKKGIIGKKLGMTQVFADDGAAVGVTAIEVESSVVIQVKTKEKDGYDAIQLGYGRRKQKGVTKPLQGHFAKADKGFFRKLQEFEAGSEKYEVGQEITRRNLNIQPTLEIRPGFRFNVFVHKDIVLEPYDA